MMKNSTLMQYFEWYLPSDNKHWQRLKDDANHLAEIGITGVWMPPAFKATGQNDVGYGVYDLFDLGEFDQKGGIPTKYGTKEEYLAAIQALKEQGIRPIADVVLNHKAAGDKKETFQVLKMDPNDRQTPISEPYEIEGYTNFIFPGRQGEYNDFEWHYYHFSGLDYDAKHDETGVYMILGEGKGWADNESVDDEKGNYDYLMYDDIDYSHPEVLQNLKDWVKWFIQTTQVEGFRMDALKHIDREVIAELIANVKEVLGDDKFYVFGEYWNADYETDVDYLEDIDFEFDLVDVKLHMNFHDASVQGADYDLRQLFDHTLMANQSMNAVTFVENHDTQEGQALASPIDDWFKPLAYGVILLRLKGLPTVFYGDYYGMQGEHPRPGMADVIDALLALRRDYAYGEEELYFDHPNVIGWTRLGTDEHPNGLAAVISNGDDGWKTMSMGELNANNTFVDYLGNCSESVTLDDKGQADFPVKGGSISVWVDKDSMG